MVPIDAECSFAKVGTVYLDVVQFHFSPAKAVLEHEGAIETLYDFCTGRVGMERQLATALAGLTTGIYVLTVRAGERQHGMSSSWVTQVSGAPVLIMAAVDQQHVTHQMVLESGAFALNIVGAQSKHLEDYFYSAQAQRPDNLTPFALESGRTGAPWLRDALASLDCRLVSTHAAGDHTLFVGEVVEARVRSTDRPLTSQDLPYVYLGGKVLFDQASRRLLGPGE